MSASQNAHLALRLRRMRDASKGKPVARKARQSSLVSKKTASSTKPAPHAGGGSAPSPAARNTTKPAPPAGGGSAPSPAARNTTKPAPPAGGGSAPSPAARKILPHDDNARLVARLQKMREKQRLESRRSASSLRASTPSRGASKSELKVSRAFRDSDMAAPINTSTSRAAVGPPAPAPVQQSKSVLIPDLPAASDMDSRLWTQTATVTQCMLTQLGFRDDVAKRLALQLRLRCKSTVVHLRRKLLADKVFLDKMRLNPSADRILSLLAPKDAVSEKNVITASLEKTAMAGPPKNKVMTGPPDKTAMTGPPEKAAVMAPVSFAHQKKSQQELPGGSRRKDDNESKKILVMKKNKSPLLEGQQPQKDLARRWLKEEVKVEDSDSENMSSSESSRRGRKRSTSERRAEDNEFPLKCGELPSCPQCKFVGCMRFKFAEKKHDSRMSSLHVQCPKCSHEFFTK